MTMLILLEAFLFGVAIGLFIGKIIYNQAIKNIKDKIKELQKL
jgi:uncharacterized protein YneF (UPF0154 family)